MTAAVQLTGVPVVLESSGDSARVAEAQRQRLLPEAGLAPDVAEGNVDRRLPPIIVRAALGAGKDAPIDVGVCGTESGNDIVSFPGE